MPVRLQNSKVLSPGFLFGFLSVVLFILYPLLSLDAGISGDEPVHYDHARMVHAFYTSGGQDTSALHTPVTNLKYYGQFFDNLSYAINRLTGSEHPYQVRHLMNAVAGATLVWLAGRLAILLGGYPAGLLTLLFLFFSPRLLGHSFNNLKDIPFALGYLLSVYGLVSLLRQQMKPGFKALAAIALGLAMALGTRAGGLLIIPMVLFFGWLGWIREQHGWLKNRTAWFSGFRLAGWLFLTLLIGYYLGILYWPYALTDPLRHPLESLHMMTRYEVSIRTVFEGAWLWSEHLPWYYGLKWIGISTPLVILAGAAGFLLLLRKFSLPVSSLLLFAVGFPVIWTIIRDSNLYGGWRHLLFIYPLLGVLSALAWSDIFTRFPNRIIRMSLALILISGVAGPLRQIIRNHPLEYVYFNQLAGGTNRQAGQFETDYYFHALRQAVEWVNKQAVADPDRPLRIASNFPLSAYQEYVRIPFETRYVNYYRRGLVDWDYAIFSSTYTDPRQLALQAWPAENPAYTVQVDGLPVCVVISRDNRDDLAALNAYRNWNFSLADSLYEQHLSDIPTHETSLLYRAWTKRHQGDLASSDSLADCLLTFHPNSDHAWYLKARNALNQKDLRRAENLLDELKHINPKFVPAHALRDSLNRAKTSSQADKIHNGSK